MSAMTTEASAKQPGSKYDRLIAIAKSVPSVTSVVVHPCDESSLQGAVESAEAGIIKAILVGPAAKIKDVAARHGLNISGYEIVDTPPTEAAAAAKGVELIHEGRGEVLMKGSLHTDEIMRAVTAKVGGLRTERRISHVFIMDVPSYDDTVFVTDAAINIAPISMRSATSSRMPSTSLTRSASARRRGSQSSRRWKPSPPRFLPPSRPPRFARWPTAPLAFDNAIDMDAARIKGIKSEVAGRAQILVVPDLESGNMLAKNLAYFAKAYGAGVVLGARVPVVLTSRADSPQSRMGSAAVAALQADSRRKSTPIAAA